MSALSLIHLAAAFGAMLLGFAVLALRKGTARHRILGWIYVCSLLLALTAILIGTRSHPAPFAGYAIFIVAAIAAAVGSSRFRSSVRAWRGWHAGLMLLTLLGSVMAASSIGAGAITGALSGPLFYRMFNVIILLCTPFALILMWRSRTIWGTRPSAVDLRARRRYTLLVALSSTALIVAQWPLAFP